MNDTESTCLGYIMQCGIRGMEFEQMKQYYKERGVSDEMIDNADKVILALAELHKRYESEVSAHE